MLKRSMNKQGALSIPVVLFAIGSIFLMFYALYTFQEKSNTTKKELEPSLFMNKIYDSEIRITFYVKSAIEQTIKETNKKDFQIEEFNKELLKKLQLVISTKDNLPEYENSEYFDDGIKQIMNQINENNIKYSKGLLSIKFYVNIITKYEEDNKKLLDITRKFNIEEERVIEEVTA